jgi:hypothetical protein
MAIIKSSSCAPYLVEWYLFIRPEKISWLRFILEGYDGIALLTTMSAKTGLVRLQSISSTFEETMHLLDSLAADLTPFFSHDSN